MAGVNHPSTGRARTSKRVAWGDLRDSYLSGEAVWALLLILVGSIGLNTGLGMDIRQAHDPLGGRFFPVMNSLLLILAAGAVLLSPLARLAVGQQPKMGEEPGLAPDVAGAPDPEDEPRGMLEKPLVRVGFMAAIAIGYVTLMDLVGYIPATILGMVGVLYLLGTRRPRSLLIGPVLTTILVYLIFTNLLFIRLP